MWKPFFVQGQSNKQTRPKGNSPTNRLSVITLNIKNVKGNLQKLIQEHDIICLQEHWLFGFELKLLDEISDNHKAHAKSVDMNNPIPPIQVPRGYGGSAILYRKNWNVKVTKHSDGQDRINVIELHTTPKICIVNVYLPSRGNNTKDSYQSTLDEISEILQKYGNTHALILCGDMNASLNRHHENNHDKMFKTFIKDHNLTTKQDGTPTFTHPNGEDKYEIDYILTNSIAQKLIQHSVVNLDEPLNTSDHVAVSTTLAVKYDQKNSVRKQNTQPKPNWNKCNIDLYKSAIKTQLDEQCLSDTNIFSRVKKLK